MKRLIYLLITIALGMLSPNESNAQNLDTVLIRPSITLQAQDWAWVVGSAGDVYSDSANAVALRRIRTKCANASSWTQNIAVDSLPGKVCMGIYSMVKTADAGEIVSRYTAITGAFEAKPQLTPFITTFNANLTNRFTSKRDRGKTILLDN